MLGFWVTDHKGYAAAWYADITPALRRMRTLGHRAKVTRAKDGAIMGVCIQKTSLSIGAMLRNAERHNIKKLHGAEASERYAEAVKGRSEWFSNGGGQWDADKTSEQHHAMREANQDKVEATSLSHNTEVHPPNSSDLGIMAECHHPNLSYHHGFTAREDATMNFDWSEAPAAFDLNSNGRHPVEAM